MSVLRDTTLSTPVTPTTVPTFPDRVVTTTSRPTSSSSSACIHSATPPDPSLSPTVNARPVPSDCCRYRDLTYRRDPTQVGHVFGNQTQRRVERPEGRVPEKEIGTNVEKKETGPGETRIHCRGITFLYKRGPSTSRTDRDFLRKHVSFSTEVWVGGTGGRSRFGGY